jgi:signal transduction histidine kinase
MTPRSLPTRSCSFCSLEAIQNAAKHGGGGAGVSVALDRRKDRIYFSIADDGLGMDVEGPTTGVGLVNMRDRIGAVGGELDIVSLPGRGTTVSGWVPAVTSESQGITT